MDIHLTKEFNFEMAHALTGYDGKCKNIHGHSYTLFVTISGMPETNRQSPKQGMVIDFGDLKHIVNETIIEPFDHALVLASDSPYNIGMATKTVITSFQPTCENLLIHFSQLLATKMPAGIKLYSLKLYETATSYAELFM